MRAGAVLGASDRAAGRRQGRRAPDDPSSRPVSGSGRGFWPLFLGGVVAAGLGAAALFLLRPPQGPDEAAIEFRRDVGARLEEQERQIAELDARLAADGSGMTQLEEVRRTQDDLAASIETLATRVTETESTLGSLRDRLAALESRPVADGDGSNAPESRLSSLRDRIAALQSDVEAQRDRIAALENESVQAAEAQRSSARTALRRAALTRLRTALDTGAGFSPVLADLEETGLTVPDALEQVAETGAPTLSRLREEFPDLARSALAAARGSEGAGAADGLAALLRDQLGVRSLEPRAGDDPDAILSRAEAALQEGRLSDTLAEIETLPEPARAVLSDWTRRARSRLDAVAAIEALGAEVN